MPKTHPRAGARPARPRALAAALSITVALLLLAVPSAGAATPERLVTLTPFTANTAIALGVKPVAVGQSLGGDERFSKRLNGVKRLTLSHPLGPNMDELALLDPDLVMSSPTWAKGNNTMRGLGIRVVTSEPNSVAAVPAETRRIGTLLGRSAKARTLAGQQSRAIATARNAAKSSPTVLLLLGVGRQSFAFLANSWGGDIIRQAGGKLLTEGLKASGGFVRISDELVVQRDPDVIIAVPHGNTKDIDAIAQYMRSNPAWQSTKAVRNKQLYVSTDNSLLQAWTTVARTIYDVQTKYLKNR